MAVGYRTVLNLEPAADALNTARQAVAHWVGEKAGRHAVDHPRLDLAANGIHQLSDDMVVTTALLEDNSAQRTQQVFRLLETNQTGRWQVTIVAVSNRSSVDGQQTLMVEVDPLHLEPEEAILVASPPRLVRRILNQHSAYSGGVVMSAAPRLVDESGIAEVLQAITDPHRSAAVVVAACLDGVELETWADVVGRLLRDSVGVATGFALTPAAATALNQRLPHGFRVLPGGIRTFAYGTDITDDTDQYRHRYLGPQTFGRHLRQKTVRGRMKLDVDPAFAATHAKRSRQRFLDVSLPLHVRHAIDHLRTAEFKIERDEAGAPPAQTTDVPVQVAPKHPEPSSPVTRPRHEVDSGPATEVLDESETEATTEPDVSSTSKLPEEPWISALQALVESITGSQDITVKSVTAVTDLITSTRRTLETAERQLEDVFEEWQNATDERDALRRELDDAQIEMRISLDTALDYQRGFEHYQRALLEAQLYQQLTVPEEEDRWESPDNFDEFLLRVNGDGTSVEPVSEYVLFTGDPDAAMAVDDRDQTSRYVRHMWDFVRVLHDFGAVRETGFAGDVRKYLNDESVPGHKCTHRQHAANESESVRSRKAWKDERLFPVPASVHPDGKVHMMAHFRPSRDSTFAPRMHYYDDTENTGKVYIGYIGKHLTTTKTASV
jgi:exonuclease VII small subunit